MSCEFCSDKVKRDVLDIALRGLKSPEASYCPLCGQPIAIQETLEFMKEQLDDLVDTNTVRDENGNKMVFERTPWSTPDKPYEVPTLGFDLDNIDISREMEILHQDDLNRKKQIVAEAWTRILERKAKEDE